MTEEKTVPQPADWDIYVASDRDLANGLSHSDIARAAFEAGAKSFQLRDKTSATDDELMEEAREIVALANQHGAAFIVNDRVDLAAESGAHGLHIGQDDMDPEQAREIMGPDAIIGISAHNVEQAEFAQHLGKSDRSRLDYISWGPVFETTTKENPDPATGLSVPAKLRSSIALPLGAIGGVNKDNLEAVAAAGFDFVAIISAAMADTPEAIAANVRELRELFLAARERYRK